MKEKLRKFCQKLPIRFHYQNYKIIFVFLFPIFGVVYNRIRDKNVKIRYEYFFMEAYFISYLFAFIPYIIEYLICEHKNGKEKNYYEIYDDSKEQAIIISNHSVNLVKVKKVEKDVLIKRIIFIALIVFMCSSCIAFRHFDFEGAFDKKTMGLVYKIPILFILSYFILKFKFFRHHLITLGFNILSLLTKYILGIIQSHSEKFVKEHLWKYFLFALSHSALLISGKFFMDKYQKNPYFLMLTIGLINGLIFIIIASLKYLITAESQIFTGFKDYISSFPTFLIFMADIICQFIYNLGSWITVYYFSPLHTIISENAIEIYYYIYDYKSNKKYWEELGYVWNSWFIPSVLVINLICSLIFNEILILKCCKCDYYTRIRIEEREKKEIKYFLELDEQDDIDDNDNRFESKDDNNPEIL